MASTYSQSFSSFMGGSNQPSTNYKDSFSSFLSTNKPVTQAPAPTSAPKSTPIPTVQAPSGGFKIGQVIPNIEKAVSNVANTVKNKINPPVKLPSGLTLNYVTPGSNIVSSTTPATKSVQFMPTLTDIKPGQKQLTSDQLKQIQPNLATPVNSPSAKMTVTPKSLKDQQILINQIQQAEDKVKASYPGTAQILHDITTDPLSLKANPTKIIQDVGKAFIDPLKQELTRIKAANIKNPTPSQKIGSQLSEISGAANVVFSPISALFAATNDLPVIGSLSRMITLPFSFAGEGATQVSNKIVDQLPISQKAKNTIKPGVGEIFALAAQIYLGKVTAIDPAKKAELVDKFGEKDANTIIDQATNLAKEKKDANQVIPDGEHTPQDVIDHVVNNKLQDTPDGKALLKSAVEAQQNEQNIHIGELPQELQVEKPVSVKSTDELLTYIDRQGFREPSQIEALKQDIIKNGIKYPIELIKKADGSYEINDGTHRVQIAKDLGISEIPTKIVKDETIQAPKEVKTVIEKPKDITQNITSEEKPITKPSGVAKSIEQKAVDSGVTKGFEHLAQYDPITWKEQFKKSADLINKDVNEARSVVRGEKPLPEGLNGVFLVAKMEEYIKAHPELNKTGELSYELANSPLVTEVSKAAQTLGGAGAREADSATAKLAELKQARQDKVKEFDQQKKTVKATLKAETEKVNLSKEELSWNKFLEDIKC